MKRTWLGLLLILSGCAYQNPNVYTYGWRPPAPPDPESRSFMGCACRGGSQVRSEALRAALWFHALKRIAFCRGSRQSRQPAA